MSNQRVPLYYELFFGLCDNQKLEQGLRYVTSPQSQCGPLMQEMALAVLDEMDFFRDYKSHPFTMTVYRSRPPRQKNYQPVVTMDPIAYDPLLQEMAKAVLEEIDYNRGQRKCAQGLICFALIACVVAVIVVAGLVFWSTHR